VGQCVSTSHKIPNYWDNTNNGWVEDHGNLTFSSLTLATVNQHPREHHAGWMISGQKIIFCLVSVH
jgi:hypothetical protein